MRTLPRYATDFYRMVPKGPVSNLLFRRALMRRVMFDPGLAEMLKGLCGDDIFFWINCFVWTTNPKRAFRRKKLPFITYRYQDKGIVTILESLDEAFDVSAEKSRQMGASWLFAIIIVYCWLFRQGQNFLLLSRSDEYVDKSNEPKSLFWKLQFIIGNLPQWMMPAGWDAKKHRLVKRIVNPENHNTIVGEATTEHSGRGGSFTAILLDEFAACDVGAQILKSTRDATGTRWFNSTPGGTGNAHYKIVQLSRQNPKQVRPLRFHWSEHPEYGKGLYRFDIDRNGNEVIVRLDKRFPLPDDYFTVNEDLVTSLKRRGFWTDWPLRSPWFDKQCSRATTRAEISQELEIDYAGSGYQFFEPGDITDLISLYCTPPKYLGDLDYDVETLDPLCFRPHGQGRLQIWCELVHDAPPLGHPYVIGVDCSAGTGASNSVASVWDAKTTELVAILADPTSGGKPERFAKMVVALCRWFDHAYLIWETNGSGRAFGDAVIEIGYAHYYTRAKDDETGETGAKAGWYPSADNKYQLLSQYRGALVDRTVFNRSEDSMRECLEYIFAGGNKVEHASLNDMEDPSGARDQHGDRVISCALACKVIDAQPKAVTQVTRTLTMSSVAGRRAAAAEAALKLKRDNPYVF